MMRLLLVLLALTLLLSPRVGSAQSTSADTAYHPVLNPSLNVTRRVGAITLDGDLSDPGWEHAARTSTFTLCFPHPMLRPPVTTDALVTYDDDYLYVAMIAHDPHPENIRHTMIGRDNIFSDDFMGLILDTYGDAKKAFEIYINPQGVQGDLFWTATNEDITYDLIYDGESKITADGWQTELRIPFRSLRFPSVAVQNFHVSFWRSYPRDVVYKMGSSPIDFRQPCWFCQLGPLTGIENIPHSGSFELLPSLASTQSAALTAPSGAAGSHLINDPVKLKPSLGLDYSLGTASSIEATINPDFSQVESDAARVSVNTTFALFYPEHRPFFQDGSDLFNTYLSAIYTRSIDDPLAAVKLLHRDPTLSVAYLGGYDLHSPVIIPLEERSIVLPDVGKSYSNIIRVSKTLGSDTYLGALVTDRRYDDKGSNTVAGIDGRLRLFENVAVIGQGLWSGTVEPNTHTVGDSSTFDNGLHTTEYDGERFGGTAAFVQIERLTPTLDAHIGYQATNPAFRAGNGSFFNNDLQIAVAMAKYKFPIIDPPSWLKWLVEADPMLSAEYDWNYQHETKLRELKPLLHLDLTAQSSIWYFERFYTEQFHGIVFDNMKQWDVGGQTSFDAHLSLYGEITAGRTIARNAAIPFAGEGIDVSATATLKPIGSLLIEPSYIFSQLKKDDGSVYYNGSIYRSRFTYQFTRELDARIVAQYDGFSQQFEFDPLVTYKLNPFSSFYFGSTHDFATIGGTRNLQPTARQFFAKVQYLIQG